MKAYLPTAVELDAFVLDGIDPEQVPLCPLCDQPIETTDSLALGVMECDLGNLVALIHKFHADD